MEEDEALALASKLCLNSNVKLISISLINKTHPSLEKALDELTLGTSIHGKSKKLKYLINVIGMK